MKHLEFKVNSQTLKRLDGFKPAAGSVDYLTASFTFSEDWSGTAKTAKCRKDNEVYSAAINSSGVCKIPHEVLAQDEAKRAFGVQEFYISVEGKSGTKTITTEEIKIALSLTSAGKEANAQEPTPDIYAQYIAGVEAATKENADTATEAAASAAARATEAAASAASLKNDFSNALKGKASGSVVRVDDVAPVEHLPAVKVSGKNLLPFPYREQNKTVDGVTFTAQANGGIALSGTATSNFVAFELYKGKPLATKGKIKISLLGEFAGIYIRYDIKDGSGNTLLAGGAATSNLIDLDEYPTAAEWNIFVRNNDGATEISGVAYPQIEIGEITTEYTPYIDPTTITLSRLGKNLLQPRNNNGAGYTVKPNDDGSATVTGAANTTNPIYLTIATVSESNPLRLTAGQAYKMQGWSNNEKNINIKLMKDDGEAAWTSPSNVNSYFENGYLNIVQIYVESIGHAEGDTSLCGVYRFQLEVGAEATAFEAYKEAAEYTPEADGTINGLTSISPTMTLLSDHEGVTIDCEYNRDINKAFARLEALLNG